MENDTSKEDVVAKVATIYADIFSKGTNRLETMR